ncbi:MAG: hypothetical protein QXQ02_02600 [Halobacteria archaeon]
MFEDATLISLILITSFLSIITIISSLYIFQKLPYGDLKDFAALVLSVILIFTLGGFIRSVREIFDLTHLSGINIVYIEYILYTFTYVIAIYKIRKILRAAR